MPFVASTVLLLAVFSTAYAQTTSRIVFHRGPNVTDAYLMNDDGSNETNVTPNTALDIDVAPG